jgi:hypothetical protein
MGKMIAAAAVLGVAGMAQGQVVISEILGSTAGSDWEFVELVNMGVSAVDISGWTIELWDSDAGGSFGSADGGSPYTITSGSIAAGGTFTLANALAVSGYGSFTQDQFLGADSVENSSYTAILADTGANAIDSVFVSDGGAGDMANRAGAAFSASLTVGPDGTFLPAGFARTDLSGGFVILEFDHDHRDGFTLVGGTPGVNQIVPAPGAVALLGLGGLAATRRRR